MLIIIVTIFGRLYDYNLCSDTILHKMKAKICFMSFNPHLAHTQSLN